MASDIDGRGLLANFLVRMTTKRVTTLLASVANLQMLVFLDHPEVDVNNNYVEGSLRPFVLGRNAWLFSQSVQGAEASAVYYSLIETAKKNLVDPYSYLELLFKELPRCVELEEFEKLLPYNISEYFQIKKYLLTK